MSLTDAASKIANRLDSLVPTTFKTVYDTPPQSAPADGALPAVFVRPTSGLVSYSASQRQVVHTLEIVSLVKRSDYLPNDYAAAMPLVEPVIQSFETFTSLGDPKYFDARITSYEIGPAGFTSSADTPGDAQYVAMVMTITVKEKFGVTMS